MADADYFQGDGIAVFDAADELTGDFPVNHIVLTGTAAGSFVLVLGNVTLTITTGANDLCKVIPIDRTVHFLELTSGPTGAAMIVFMKKHGG